MDNTLSENRDPGYESLLRDIAEEHEVSATLLQELITYEQGRVHLQRRRGARNDIQQIIEQHIFEA